MPAYARKKPTYGRRKTRRRRRRRYTRPQTRLGWPEQKVVKLKFVETFVLNVGVAGVPAKHFFRANGCVQPNYTGGGSHQPMMWDNWTALYNHYVVLGAKIHVQVYDPTTAASTPQIIGVSVNDDLTTSSTWTTMLESGETSYQIVSGQANYPKNIYRTYSAKKYFNVVDVKDNLQRLGASTASDPDEAAFFNVFAIPYDVNSDLGAIRCMATITYIVSFSEPKDQVGS